LRQLRQLCQERQLKVDRPVVFEGNVAADPAGNILLRKALEAPAPREIPLAPRAWLGEAISIKEPPAVVFHRRPGGNLLLVGQREELALGVLAGCLIGLAAFSPRRGSESATRFHVLDGARPETSAAGFWTRLADALPVDLRVARPREAADVVGQLANLLSSRQEQDNDTAPAVFLLLYNLARFSDLQKSDDDFGLGSVADADSTSARQLQALLRDGPAHGIHTLIWSDTYHNLLRWLDRQHLPDLEMRVLFQMSATDSSHLMDSPAASQLGAHRAILYSEEQGRAERFRPYGWPTEAWLSDVRVQLRRREENTLDVESPHQQ
jgi:hypothetical protein